MRDKLTSKQEHFAQLVASGATYSDAYRDAYDVSPDASPVTAYVNSSKLAKNTKVALRVQELQQVTETALAVKRLWTTDRLVEEAETNLIGAREGKQFGPANRALDFIGRATGLLSDKPREPQVPPVTRITINLAPGVEPPADQIVESSYRELPGSRPALAEGTPDIGQGYVREEGPAVFGR